MMMSNTRRNHNSNSKKSSLNRRQNDSHQQQVNVTVNQSANGNGGTGNNKRHFNNSQRRRLRGKQGGSSNPTPATTNTRMQNFVPATTVVVDTQSLIRCQRLEKALVDVGYSEVENISRRVALDGLDDLLSRWSKTLRSLDPNSANANVWQRPGVALITFGSYRLRADRPSSDLDVLALCPPYCKRSDFFTSLVEMLQKESPRIQQVHPIPGAYTPVIKFVLHGIHVDLVFARVANPQKLIAHQHKSAPRDVITTKADSHQRRRASQQTARLEYLIDDTDLAELDEPSVRSLNGARVSQILLQSVPHLKNYRTVLRAVKEWAVQAGIYSNVLGFLGGVNWAILVAWVCMRNPAADTPTLLETFYRTFADWKWPTPVLLMPIQDTPPEGGLILPAWNPQTNPRDRLHIMPIITPAYPSMNSSYNVGIPQLRRIRTEMERAWDTLNQDRPQEGGGEKLMSNGNPNPFKTLFRTSDFFSQHSNFLQIMIRAACLQDFLEWHRLVESRLRLLIASLETPQVHAWPFAKFFEVRYNRDGMCLGPGRSEPDCLHESLFFIGLRFADGLDTVDLRHLTSDFLHKVNTWPGRKPDSMDLSVAYVNHTNLPAFVKVMDEPQEESFTSNSKGASNDKQIREGDLLLLEDVATATTTTEDEDCPSLGGAASSVASTSTTTSTAASSAFSGVVTDDAHCLPPPPPSGVSVPAKKFRKTDKMV